MDYDFSKYEIVFAGFGFGYFRDDGQQWGEGEYPILTE